MLGGNFGAPKAPLKPVFLEEILPISLLNDGFHKENHMGKDAKRQNFPPAAGQKVKHTCSRVPKYSNLRKKHWICRARKFRLALYKIHLERDQCLF